MQKDLETTKGANCKGKYAMVATGLNIAHVVGVVSSFMANPCKAHLSSQSLYLKGTKSKCLSSRKCLMELH